MTELIEILSRKVEKANEFHKKLDELIEKRFNELKDDEKKSLPKFTGRFNEGSLNEYFENLTKSVKNPIRFRKKRALEGLVGVVGIEKVKDDIFDDDSIEETIQILQDIKSYERLFRILSREIPSLILQNISDTNLKLKDFKDDIENLKKIEDIKSESVKNHCLQKYIKKELNIYDIGEIKEKAMEIEKNLNLQIKQKEISLIDEVHTLIDRVREYEEKFENGCLDLNDAKKRLKNQLDELEREYKQIKREMDFWQILCSEIYIIDVKIVDTVKNKLKELKEKCEEEYKSFAVLKQIYNLGLKEWIEEPREFVKKLEKIISLFPALKIENKQNLDDMGKLYESIEWLEEIQYPNVEELCKRWTFENIEGVFTQINEEYTRLKEDLKMYQQILVVEEEQINAYPLLKQKIDECRNKLKNMVGDDFESLIIFLKGKTEDIEVDEQTLKNFIKTIRPILKEALRI